MNKFSRLLLNRKDGSNTDIDNEDQTNSMEISISNIENNLLNWNIPKQNINTIYKIGSFDYFQGYSIKTTEKTLPLLQNHQNIQLFSKTAIDHHKKNYKFLHIGLIQVAIKPMTRLGIDVPTLMILRDARLLNFKQSLLAMAESNICNGPIYFNCYPNYTISLFDRNILDTLTLTVKTKNLEIKSGSDPIVVIYRIYYKTMTTTIEPRSKLISPRDETLLFEANSDHSSTNIPKRLKWNEITRNQTWNLDSISQPKPIELNNQVSSITEYTDGNVDVSFGNISARHSTYIPESSSSIKIEELKLRRANSMKVKGVDFSNNIPKPLYENDEISDTFSNRFEPTKSEMDFYEENQ